MTNNMDFTTLIRNRYSCRAFDPREVGQEIVDRILEAGRIAPTAVNRQPVHVWAVTDAAMRAAIQGVTRSNYGAPVLLVVGCRPADAWVRRYDGKNGAEVDASIVATNLMLAAENEGLATLWVGSFDPMGLAALLPGTDGYDLVWVDALHRVFTEDFLDFFDDGWHTSHATDHNYLIDIFGV